MYSQFKKDLSIGQKYEVIAQDRIIEYYENKLKVIETCDNYKYDFRLSNDFTYEVKFERSSLKTNNIFLEYIAFQKPSGIDMTQADYYIFVLPVNETDNQFVLIDVDTLKQLIIDKQYTREHTDKYKSGYIFSKFIIIHKGILF
jgi:hypothetical protein